MTAMPVGRLSLAEQIAQLQEIAPIDYDPEELHSGGPVVDDDPQIDVNASRQHYVEVGPSSLRNKLPSVAHPKYEGTRISRKELLEIEDEDGSVEEDEEVNPHDERTTDDENGTRRHSQASEDEVNEPDEIIGNEPDEGEDEEQEEISEARSEPVREDHPKDVMSSLKKAREEDIKKGQAVKRQLALGDALLDTRIRLHKSVVAANSLPRPCDAKEYLEDPDCSDLISSLLQEASLLFEDLYELHENLLTINDITKPPQRKRLKLNPEASIEEYQESFMDSINDVAALEKAVHPYALQTLVKWSSKIQAVSPSALLPSNRGAFLKGSQKPKNVVQLIEETLADREKLLARTQVARPKKPRVGVVRAENDGGDLETEDKLDPEIFDDTDFYQKMLRDVIDSRTGGDGSTTNQDWMDLQKQKKSKKKIDTKASKGRKLRYEAHEKLQNFMVPVPVVGEWHEEQVDELFASILGKGFENIMIETHEPEQLQNIELTGFRVFG